MQFFVSVYVQKKWITLISAFMLTTKCLLGSHISLILDFEIISLWMIIRNWNLLLLLSIRLNNERMMAWYNYRSGNLNIINFDETQLSADAKMIEEKNSLRKLNLFLLNFLFIASLAVFWGEQKWKEDYWSE